MRSNPLKGIRNPDGGETILRGSNPSREGESSDQVDASSFGLARTSIAVVGRSRGQILVKTSRELVVLHGTSYFGVCQCPGVPAVSGSSELER
jgi:hypothetical protein